MSAKPSIPAPRVRDIAGDNLHALWSRAAKVVVPVAAVGGFVADVLTPIAPFVSILAGLTAFLCISSGIVWFGFKRRQIRKALADGEIDAEEFRRIGHVNAWSIAFAFNLTASLILMLFFGAQRVFAEANPDRGAIANAVPTIATLQAQLLGLQQKTDRIDATTQRLEKKAEVMQETLAKLDDRVANMQIGSAGASEPAPPKDCPAPAKLIPYGKVFEGGDLKVEMAEFKNANARGMHDVVLRIHGGPAYEAGIDGKAIHYATKPGFDGSGVYMTYNNAGQEPVRMLILPKPEGQLVRVFLKDDKPFDVQLNPAKSKSLCVSALEL